MLGVLLKNRHVWQTVIKAVCQEINLLPHHLKTDQVHILQGKIVNSTLLLK